MTRPVVQLAAAFAVVLFGAALIALWAVGVVLVITGALWAADAVLRDPGSRSSGRLGSHDEVLERWRQAR